MDAELAIATDNLEDLENQKVQKEAEIKQTEGLVRENTIPNIAIFFPILIHFFLISISYTFKCFFVVILLPKYPIPIPNTNPIGNNAWNISFTGKKVIILDKI